MWVVWQRLRFDESGQDLIEYSLLLSIVTVTLIIAMPHIAAKMSAGYLHVVGPAGINSLWIPNNPS